MACSRRRSTVIEEAWLLLGHPSRASVGLDAMAGRGRILAAVLKPAEAPSVVVDTATLRVSVPILGGSWSYSFRDGAISITRVLPWSLPVPGNEDSIAQVRWSTTWGIGTYGGEFGVRQALNLDSRVVIADRELSNTSALFMSTTRFRPQNLVYFLVAEAALAGLAYMVLTLGPIGIGAFPAAREALRFIPLPGSGG